MFTYKILYEQNFTDYNFQTIEVYTSNDVEHDYQYQRFIISFESKSNIYIVSKFGGSSKLGLISLMENYEKNYIQLSEMDKSLIIKYIPFGRKSGDELYICCDKELQFLNLPVIDFDSIDSLSDIKEKFTHNIFEHKTDEEMTEILDKLGFNVMSINDFNRNEDNDSNKNEFQDVNDFINQDEIRMEMEYNIMEKLKSGLNENHSMVDENQKLEEILSSLGLGKNNINLSI